jgi:UDP-N-acetylmuramoylalanine--D-glutamate ligase
VSKTDKKGATKQGAKTEQTFRGVKALVMGLGLHGGGVATVKWLVKYGAKVTATDKRDRKTLAPSIAALKGVLVRYVLGEHRMEDFRTHDLIVVNPGVPRESEYLAAARAAGKRIENVASLFFSGNDAPIIGVTGTRGKTTTALFIAELLKNKYPKVCPSGNTENALLDEFDRVQGKNIPVVAELSSWQLEYLPISGRAPHVSVITNLYPDHLNRYKGMRDYASAKANIFRGQKGDDFLVLNYDNEWTEFFLKQKPKAIVFFVSVKPLPKQLNGLFVRNKKLVFRFDGMEQQLFSVERFIRERGAHNLENLLAAVLAVKLFDPTVSLTESLALKLPTPRMRQEVVYKKGNLTVVNDSCATSPDGVIAALKRFAPMGNVVLITGGTDKELEFGELAKMIKKYIPQEQLILLEGSATAKLITLLSAQKLSRLNLDNRVYETFSECGREAFRVAKTLKGKTTILFSPGAASFEKFLHEFDRGEKFNALIKKYLHSGRQKGK